MEKSTELRKIQDLKELLEQTIRVCQDLEISYRDLQDWKDKVQDMENSYYGSLNNKFLNV